MWDGPECRGPGYKYFSAVYQQQDAVYSWERIGGLVTTNDMRLTEWLVVQYSLGRSNRGQSVNIILVDSRRGCGSGYNYFLNIFQQKDAV